MRLKRNGPRKPIFKVLQQRSCSSATPTRQSMAILRVRTCFFQGPRASLDIFCSWVANGTCLSVAPGTHTLFSTKEKNDATMRPSHYRRHKKSALVQNKDNTRHSSLSNVRCLMSSWQLVPDWPNPSLPCSFSPWLPSFRSLWDVIIRISGESGGRSLLFIRSLTQNDIRLWGRMTGYLRNPLGPLATSLDVRCCLFSVSDVLSAFSSHGFGVIS